MDKTMNKKNTDQEKSKKGLIIFIAVSLTLLAVGAFLLITYQPKSVAERFYENRKSELYYQEHRDAQSNKRKAERNIFLQD